MPADFVSELAERAFKKIAAGTGDAIVVILPDRSQGAATLANQLNSRPDLQAQVSSPRLAPDSRLRRWSIFESISNYYS
jgi:hypothetical protein